MNKFNKINLSRLIGTFFIWLWIGIIIVFSMCSMKLSGSRSLNSFYDVGEVYEISSGYYRTEQKFEYGHQEASGKVVLDEGAFDYRFNIEKNKNKFQYFCLTVKNISSTSVECTVYYDVMKNDEIIESADVTVPLQDGINLITVKNNQFNRIRVVFKGESGASLIVKKMELRESKPVFTWEKVFKYTKLFSGYYVGVSLITYIIFLLLKKYINKWDMYGIFINTLQKIYLSVFSTIKEYFDLKNKRIGRIILFLLMFIYSVFIEIKDYYYTYFKYNMLVYVIIIFLLILLSLPDKCKSKDWNNLLVWSWGLLWAMACISDFFVKNEYRYMGYLMLSVVGLLFFVWNNMEKPENLIQDFVRAVHIFFACISLFCLLFRPEIEGARYSGFCENPSIFCLYLGTVCVVILGELEYRFQTENKLWKLLPFILELGIGFSFCWKSQSATPMIAVFVISIIWFFRMIVHAHRVKKQKKLFLIFTLLVILIVPIYTCVSIGLNYIPKAVDKTIVFEQEQPEEKYSWGMEVKAADLSEKMKETRLGKKFRSNTLTGVLTGRDYYYKAHLRAMNLFGHEKRVIMWGRRRLPHNSIIAIAYRYGVFAVVPYVIMLISAIGRTYKYSKRKNKYSSIPFYVCLSAIIMSLADNVEQPFIWLPWMGLYIMMGICFSNENLQNEKDEVEKSNCVKDNK